MDNPLTLQEAKDQVAKIHYSDKWDKIDWYHLNEINERTEPPYMEEILMKEVAELYARSKWDQCHAETCKLFSETMRQSLVFESYAGFAANMTKPEFKP